ncbi:hypothetical protein [Solicola gregarius]|uniref:Lipoprotein n=1 Tax=Solicola gregarius TaxID=2908642 RepID=A0AA46TE09_9ACTN|nr:hypothetical protein [Solicola gregarius]UYM03609.1 hypothetical protein L0C25_13725 [Solicola gregarius]
MTVRRAACAVVITALLGGCVVGSAAANSGEDQAGKPSWKHKGGRGDSSAKADRIALDALGDADRGVDIQSLAVFNPTDLDFVGLSIAGRDFRTSQTRSVDAYLDTNRRWSGPEYRIVAFNKVPTKHIAEVRLYRVGDWDTDDPKRVTCKRLRVQFDVPERSQIRIAVPRSCLGGVRGPLRANATVWRQQPAAWKTRPAPGDGADVVPEEHELTEAAR